MESPIQKAARSVAAADALLITAGAGMGVDSGLPDFRGTDGFWRAYPAMAKLGLRFEEMANPGWFARDPELAWAFYGHRLNLYRGTDPHDGFGRLLEMGRRCRLGYFVFTSNVDGHFQKAGCDPMRVVECHGSVHHWQCAGPCHRDVWEAPPHDIEIDAASFRAIRPLPRCGKCQGPARPNILMFGDSNWIYDRTSAQEERLDQWLAEVKNAKGRLLIVEVGAGTAIPTVRHASETIRSETKGTLVRINLRESEIPDDRGISIAGGAKEAIAALAGAVAAGGGDSAFAV